MGLEPRVRREALGMALLAVGVLALAALHGLATGLVGGFLRRVLLTLLGQGALAAPAWLLACGAACLLARDEAARRLAVGGAVAGALLAAWLHLPVPVSPDPRATLAHAARGVGGGLVGGLVSWLLWTAVGPLGQRLALLLGTALAASLLLGRPVAEMALAAARHLRRATARAVEAVTDFVAVPEPDAAADPAEAGPSGTEPEPEPPLPQATTPPPPAAAGRPPAADAGSRRPARPRDAEPAPAVPAGEYRLPPLSLLPRGKARGGRGPKDAEQQGRELEETLASFGVQARVVGYQQGPAVTRFELEPAAGVKVSRIQSLASDIALRLAVPAVRIEAPIPGKKAVGIEVPNRDVATVHLRDVLETEAFQQSASPLTVALGMDTAGQPVVTTLDRLLHVLIAGATGSGKSVCINAMILSLLFKARPDQVRFVMIDPKLVELSAYNGIPHLLAPVVTEPKRAASVLRWLVREMERRYERFAETGVRDVQRFNAQARERGEEPLPLIVVVIDELADLMMVAPVEVEDAIQRLAQMARAAGIHLVVATQRPSVDVITGVIKANIPSRIAFAVSSQADSRVILDTGGAEKLLGRGDMLFYPLGATKPLRVQGAYVGEREVEAVLDFVRGQAGADYQEEVLMAAAEEGGEEGEDDDLFPEALRIVIEAGQASASLLQRRLRIGYTRAGRLIDMMEARGYVGPHLGSKPRDVRITMEEYRRLYGGR